MLIDHSARRVERRYIPFSIELAGLRWSGDWSIVGSNLCVGSAYGSASQPLGRRKPERLARDMLLDILDVWCGEQEQVCGRR